MNKLNTKMIAIIIAGLLLVGSSVVIYLAINNDEQTKEQASSQNKVSVGSKGDLEDAKLVNIGETAEFSRQKMRVNSVKTETMIHDSGQVYTAEEGTKYLIVNMTVTNTTKEPINFTPFLLLGNDGTVIEAPIEAVNYSMESLSSKKLNPNVPSTGITVYIIPSGMSSINIGGNVGSSDQVVGVKLAF